MAEITLGIIQELRKENAELRRELAFTISERDEALNKAVEMMHLVTHISETANRRGLVCLKTLPS